MTTISRPPDIRKKSIKSTLYQLFDAQIKIQVEIN
jgi:hypothetical protein